MCLKAIYHHVVRTTIYLIDLKDFNIVNQIYAEVFNTEISPARACVQVAALPKGVRVEIAAVKETTAKILLEEANYFHEITSDDWFIYRGSSRAGRSKRNG